MKKCLYCNIENINKDDFCSKQCKKKYNEKLDSLIPIVRCYGKLSNKEIELQKDFLNKKATSL